VGIEYRLRFVASDPAVVAEVLQRLPDARAAMPPGSGFEYGSAAGGWPQASAAAVAGGAYFCDHCGGAGRAVLGELVARLASAFGPVTVEEL
jgi:hypothetical protein